MCIKSMVRLFHEICKRMYIFLNSRIFFSPISFVICEKRCLFVMKSQKECTFGMFLVKKHIFIENT